jgi:hypothetical protein
MNANEKDSAFMTCELHAVTTSSYQLGKKMRLQKIMTLHVRWPARPAEHRAGLDFFGSFCIKAKRI